MQITLTWRLLLPFAFAGIRPFLMQVLTSEHANVPPQQANPGTRLRRERSDCVRICEPMMIKITSPEKKKKILIISKATQRVLDC